MAMAGIDLLETAWLALAATTLPTQTHRSEYRLDGELPPCSLCGWPDATAFKGTVVCLRCRTQILGALRPPTPLAPVAHDEVGRFLTVSRPTPAPAERPARRS